MSLWSRSSSNDFAMQVSIPSAKTVDLHEFEGLDIVLVPFHHLTVLHRCRFDRHQIVQSVLRQNETARMLAKMAGRAHELGAKVQCQLETVVGGVHVIFFELFFTDAFRPAPNAGRQLGDQIFRQAQCLADVAQRTFGAVARDGGTERRAGAAIGLHISTG